MLKQTIMENYVDECLDEVEIRGIFITEGIMNTPSQNALTALKDLFKHKILRKDREIREITIKIRENWKKHSGSYAKIEKLKGELWKIPSEHTVSRRHRYEMIADAESIMKKSEKINLDLIVDINKAEKEKANIIIALKQAKVDPGMLGNVPYLYQIIGATMIVAAIAYTSYRLYKRFMSKAAMACQDKKGKTKTICMNQYQLKGLEASKKPFTDGIKNCSKAKDPQICKAKFNKKINAIDKKITKKQNKIKKLMSK